MIGIESSRVKAQNRKKNIYSQANCLGLGCDILWSLEYVVSLAVTFSVIFLTIRNNYSLLIIWQDVRFVCQADERWTDAQTPE